MCSRAMVVQPVQHKLFSNLLVFVTEQLMTTAFKHLHKAHQQSAK